MSAERQRLFTVAGLMELAGGAIGIIGIAAGLILAVSRERHGLDHDTHPYVGAGIGIIIGSIVLGLLLLFLGLFAQVWLTQTEQEVVTQ